MESSPRRSNRTSSAGRRCRITRLLADNRRLSGFGDAAAAPLDGPLLQAVLPLSHMADAASEPRTVSRSMGVSAHLSHKLCGVGQD